MTHKPDIGGQLEPGPAGACGLGRNQPGPCDRQAGQ
jgi:hypothetical protein